MAGDHVFFLAGHALAGVAVPLALMVVAVQYLLALLAALEGQPLLAALHCPLRLAALAGDDRTLEIAGLALARMADTLAGVRAVGPPLLSADFPAGVWLKIPIVLRVEVRSAVAVVLGERLIILVVALWAFPVEDDGGFLVELLVDVLDPLFDAAEVHRDAAAGAGPDPVLPADVFRTDDAVLLVVAALALHVLRGLFSLVGVAMLLALMGLGFLLGHVLRPVFFPPAAPVLLLPFLLVGLSFRD